MKKITFILVAFFATQVFWAQAPINTIKTTPITYQDVEIRPEFPGGNTAFMKFISTNFKTPDIEGISGIIKMSFVIEPNGKVLDVKIEKDICSGCGEEAKRVLLSSPTWIPGENDGKKVRVIHQVPIQIQSY
jgi:hypothetical protein